MICGVGIRAYLSVGAWSASRAALALRQVGVMAETLAERRRRDEQVRATINQKLVDTGEKERCVSVACAVGC